MATEDMASLSELPAIVLQMVLANAQPEGGARLAACSRKLRSEATRCQLFWDNVLARGEGSDEYHVQAAAVKALTAEEAPALDTGSALFERVAVATVRVALYSGPNERTVEARWEEGLEAAVSFKEVPKAQTELLVWLKKEMWNLSDIVWDAGGKYGESVMERFPHEELVQRLGLWSIGGMPASEIALPMRDMAARRAVNPAELEAGGGTHHLQEADW